MKIYIASDHAGFELKKALVGYLHVKEIAVEDMGAFVLDLLDDYPDFIYPCALRVASGKPGETFGIIIGGSGQGEAMVANKVKGIRAAVFYGGNMQIPKLAREHNDANVLSLGARFLSLDDAKRAVATWIEAKYESGRHLKRLEKITKIETGEYKSDSSKDGQS